MLNVLQLIPSFHQGGSERQAVQLARLLNESGRCRVSVACLERDGVLLDDISRLGLGEIPEYPLTSFYDLNAMKQLRRFAAHLRELEIDVIHTHDFYSNVFGMTAAAHARVPVRIASKRETSGMRTSAQKFVELQAYKLAHAIVVNSEAVGGQLLRDGVRSSKPVTIYNGLEMSRVAPPTDWKRDETLTALNLPREETRRFVTIVANLRHEVKDHPTFLRAAKRVHEAVPESAFILAGEGGLTDSLRALAAEMGLERDAFFIGRCQHIAELLAVSDVCVLSSKAEGFSNSILEYMAAARPVVVTNVGGAREAVAEGETGYLVEAGDDETMAARLISLLNEPERARLMGAQGRRTVEQKFSCAAQLTNTLSLYQRLLAEARPATFQAMEDVHHKGV
jgi:glycosyltransferase involved in cell wall biosynthesis